MAEQEMYNEAMGAIREGDKKRARDLLSRLLKVSPDNVDYWVWMSSVVDSSRERIYCLQEALKRDPKNVTARNGLVILGAVAPDPNQMPPAGALRRKWQVVAPSPAVGEGQRKEPVSRLTLVASLFLVVCIGAVIVFVILPAFAKAQNHPTVISFHPPSPTSGPTPTLQITNTAVVRTVTPTFVGPTPLWMQMQATYTATPLYVSTSHPQIEAYRAGMTAFSRGELSKAVTFFKQVLDGQADAVDVVYYLGECYRLQGQYSTALDYYNQAIKLQPAFAPAYLGKARATLASDPGMDVMPDLEKAIALDPNLGEAYLEEARVALEKKDYTAALGYLDTAAGKLPGSPLISFYQAQAYLASGMPEQALAAAELANQYDFTSLPTYRLLGDALQANGRFADSIQPLVIYVTYVMNDVDAWTLLGKGYSAIQNWENAASAFDKALALDNKSIEATLGRGEMYLAIADGKNASLDFNHVLAQAPRSFAANLGLGRAYMLEGFNNEAYNQFRQAELFIEDEVDQAALYYWLATDLEALGQATPAARNWELLLALPAGVVPTDWSATAVGALTVTPTPVQATETGTPAPTTANPTGTPTSTKTVTPTKE